MKEKILTILSNLHPEFDYKQSENFIEDGLIDSFDVVSVIAAIDEQFNIEIDGTDVLPEYFSSVESIEKLVNKYC